MRLLFITPYAPSPIRVRPFELLRALAAQGMRITAVYPATAADEPASALLRAWGIAVAAVPVTRAQHVAAVLRHGALLPLQAAYGLPEPLVRRLRALLDTRTFDLVHVEHLRAAALLPVIGARPVVFDAVDCIALLQARTMRNGPDWRSRLIARIEHARTRRFERRICSAARVTTVTSAEDAAALQALAPQAAIHVVPNGVDLARFVPPTQPRRTDMVVFSGKMSYHANVAATQRLIWRIMPAVWQRHPATEVWIVGSDPPPAVQQLAADPRVRVTGYVPEIAPFLQQATVAVSPLRYGVGVQNKVLEALACATPTVADRQAVAALQALPGRDLLVADDDRQFSAAIVQLLEQAPLGQQLGWNGRRFVEQAHRWEASATTLVQLYQHALHPTYEFPFSTAQPRHVVP